MPTLHVVPLRSDSPTHLQPKVRIELDREPNPEPVTVKIDLKIAHARALARQILEAIRQVDDDPPPIEGPIPVLRVRDE